MCLEIRLEREEESPISNISARLRQCVTQTASRAALAEFAGPYPGIQDSNRPMRYIKDQSIVRRRIHGRRIHDSRCTIVTAV